jgi:hypothetical protein
MSDICICIQIDKPLVSELMKTLKLVQYSRVASPCTLACEQLNIILMTIMSINILIGA